MEGHGAGAKKPEDLEKDGVPKRVSYDHEEYGGDRRRV